MSSAMTVLHPEHADNALTPTGQRDGADAGDPQVSLARIAPGAAGSIGVWECEPGGWPVVDRSDTEVAHILSGRALITDDATGVAHEIAGGDLVVLPVGWSGRWDVLETVRKIYVIY